MTAANGGNYRRYYLAVITLYFVFAEGQGNYE